MIVVDTNVLSEFMRPAPSGAVVRWLQDPGDAPLVITAISVGEILFGVERLPAGRRRDHLRERFVEIVEPGLGLFVLSNDDAAARAFGLIAARREGAGLAVHNSDVIIAAIAHLHGAHLATRNTRDFESTGVELVNPWER